MKIEITERTDETNHKEIDLQTGPSGRLRGRQKRITALFSQVAADVNLTEPTKQAIDFGWGELSMESEMIPKGRLVSFKLQYTKTDGNDLLSIKVNPILERRIKKSSHSQE